jgi:hypothetical protein
MADYHLAQINLARAIAPLGDPSFDDFTSRLTELNALADESPGFVWRLQTDDGDATGIRISDDPKLLVNLSVWESTEALSGYAYRSAHMNVIRRRKEWFEPYGSTYIALWWIPTGSLPTVEDGIERLEYLDAHGPSDYSFGFRKQFAAPTS